MFYPYGVLKKYHLEQHNVIRGEYIFFVRRKSGTAAKLNDFVFLTDYEKARFKAKEAETKMVLLSNRLFQVQVTCV
jgi:hypothetical protein